MKHDGVETMLHMKHTAQTNGIIWNVLGIGCHGADVRRNSSRSPYFVLASKTNFFTLLRSTKNVFVEDTEVFLDSSDSML